MYRYVMRDMGLTDRATRADEQPVCCGSGCAVCVLDCIEEPQRGEAAVRTEVPGCCNSGCLVCVLDYRDGWDRNGEAGCGNDGSMLEMIEAIEEAQRIARQVADPAMS